MRLESIRYYGEFVGLPYKKSNGPDLLNDEQFEPKQGINCQLLIHLLYRDRLGVELPIGMWSKEIYEDDLFFDKVTNGLIREADIFVFSAVRHNSDPKLYHLAYYTGYLQDDQPILIHASDLKDTEIAPFNYFINSERYAKLMAIKRLKENYLSSLLQLRQGVQVEGM